MNAKEKAFTEELTALMKRHGVRVVTHHELDRNGRLTSEHVTFEGDGICLAMDELEAAT